jgi:hypothetical protein
LCKTTFDKGCAKSTFRKGGAKTTFDKGCAKQQHFWFYLFLKGKEK